MEPRFLILVLIATLTSASCALAADDSSQCEEIRELLDLPTREEFNRREINRSFSSTASQPDQYPNIDLDGDDVSDSIATACSRSTMPADPCGLWVELSSGRKFEFRFEVGDYFTLFRHQSKVYVLVERGSRSAKPGRRNVHLIDASGVKLVCAKI
jgi:hypothetical protein